MRRKPLSVIAFSTLWTLLLTLPSCGERWIPNALGLFNLRAEVLEATPGAESFTDPANPTGSPLWLGEEHLFALSKTWPNGSTNGNPCVSFEVAPIDKDAFITFTKEQKGNRIAIMSYGEVLVAPTVIDMLPAAGIVESGTTRWSTEEVLRILDGMRYDFARVGTDKHPIGAATIYAIALDATSQATLGQTLLAKSEVLSEPLHALLKGVWVEELNPNTFGLGLMPIQKDATALHKLLAAHPGKMLRIETRGELYFATPPEQGDALYLEVPKDGETSMHRRAIKMVTTFTALGGGVSKPK